MDRRKGRAIAAALSGLHTAKVVTLRPIKASGYYLNGLKPWGRL